MTKEDDNIFPQENLLPTVQEKSCQDFLQIELNSSNEFDGVLEASSACHLCGNRDCTRRQTVSDSNDVDNIDSTYLVFSSIYVFLVPLVAGFIGSVIANSSFMGTPQTWKTIVGFVGGVLFAVLLASWIIRFFNKSNK